MLKILLLIISVLFSFASSVKGAFGLKLGEKYPVKYLNKSVKIQGYVAYQIEPKKSISKFSEYYIVVTPISHKIVKIIAKGDYDHCTEEKDVLNMVLVKKYRTDLILDWLNHSESKRENYIILTCMNWDSELVIQYVSPKLIDLYKKEKSIIEAKKFGNSL